MRWLAPLFYSLVLAAVSSGGHAQAQLAAPGPVPAAAPAPAASPVPAASAGSAASAEEQATRDAKARQLFEAGRVAYEAGHFDNAYENFRLAFELSERPALLFNLGMSAERSRRDAEAIAAFEQYLQRLPDASNAQYVQQRIEFLRKALAEREQAQASAAGPESTPGPAGATAASPSSDDDSGVLGKWWFWGAVGVGAALVTTTVVVLASGEDDPIRGEVGGVITTLRSR